MKVLPFNLPWQKCSIAILWVHQRSQLESRRNLIQYVRVKPGSELAVGTGQPFSTFSVLKGMDLSTCVFKYFNAVLN